MKIAYLALITLLIACASKPKKLARFQEIALGSDEFAAVFFNVIEVTEGKKKDYFVNAVLSFEAPGALQITVEKEKPLFIAIGKEIVTLKPIPGKYKYTTKKVSKGERVLHIQSNEFEVSKEILERISTAKTTVVKIPATPHKNSGFDGVFRKENKNKLIEFLN